MTSHLQDDNPLDGMSPSERKAAVERWVVELVYDVSRFDRVRQRERPDFELWDMGREKAFGVEVTQLFPTESHARLNLLPDYMQSLWAGGRHKHRDDIEVLQATTVDVLSAEGEVKASNMPAIITKTHSLNDFRDALEDVVAAKSARGYPFEEFRHINLVILDWFHLPSLREGEYSTGAVFNDGIRELLRTSPFREIVLLLEGVDAAEGPTASTPTYDLIPLRELYLAEQYFLTAHAIDQSAFESELRNVEHLAALTADHLTHYKNVGAAIDIENSPHVYLGATAVGLSAEGGMEILERGDHYDEDVSLTELERLPEPIAREVDTWVQANSFGWSYRRRSRTAAIQRPEDSKISVK